jgi:hypothetical protein
LDGVGDTVTEFKTFSHTTHFILQLLKFWIGFVNRLML